MASLRRPRCQVAELFSATKRVNDLKSIVNDITLVLYKIDPNFSRIEGLLNELRQHGDDVRCLQLIAKCGSSKEAEYAKFLEL